MAFKRKRATKRVSFRRAANTAYRMGNLNAFVSAKRARYAAQSALRGVRRLNSMIETKESTWSANDNVSLPHNNVHVILGFGGFPLNPFRMGTQGALDPMADVTGQRVGDRITVRGYKMKFFIENAPQRTKVWYRIMMLKGYRGAVFDRNTIFKQSCGNKMLDVVDTEKFTIIWQKTFTIEAASATGSTVGLSGVMEGTTVQGIGTKIVSAWIPGRKFGRNGNVQYEGGSITDVKFFDYRVVIVAYDWYGTPQDVNNVGKINDAMCKLYYKDA